MKISRIEGNDIIFDEPTKLSHHNTGDIAIWAGDSQYNATYMWFLHKIQPGCVCENIVFKNLRMTVSAADQATWTEDKTRIFYHDFVYNMLMENCHITVSDSCPYTVGNYSRGKNQTWLRNKFIGKLAITFGCDVAQAGQTYIDNTFNFTSDGYVHAGERFGSILFQNNRYSQPYDSETASANAAFMYTQENDDIKIIGNTFHNLRGWIGDLSSIPTTYGSLHVEGNTFSGKPNCSGISVKNSHSAVRIINNTFDITVDASHTTSGQLRGGIITNNVLRIVREQFPGSMNYYNRASFIDSSIEQDKYYGIVKDNIGITDLQSGTIHAIDYITGPTEATFANGVLVFDPDVAQNSYFSIPVNRTGDDDGRVGISMNFRIKIPTTSTDSVQLAFELLDQDFARLALENKTFDLTPLVANIEAKVNYFDFGATATTGTDATTLIIRFQRAGTNSNDTYTDFLHLVGLDYVLHRADDGIRP